MLTAETPYFFVWAFGMTGFVFGAWQIYTSREARLKAKNYASLEALALTSAQTFQKRIADQSVQIRELQINLETSISDYARIGRSLQAAEANLRKQNKLNSAQDGEAASEAG